ncbi:MAG: 30S ribosomal protein S6 [bacterium]
MNVRDYELLAILYSELTNEEADEQIQKISDSLNKIEAVVVKVEKWGKRRLAYAVRKSKKGYYIYIHFQADPERIKDLDKNLKYLDIVNKYMIVSKANKSFDSSAHSSQYNMIGKEQMEVL